ncbi:MAG TPA: GNAT family N-acetyltransferase [Phenylobacterium sp.]|nr:GNAT family N-acetyltransferase [Phenylobacterium sp.]
MHIDVIDTFKRFAELRGDWDAVYEADPEANYFLSWPWLSDWLSRFRTVWFVLACKRDESDADYVAFLPLRMRTHFDKAHGFYNEIIFAGDAFADYTGFLTRPEFEAEAAVAFADYLKRRFNWAKLTMENLRLSDQRRRLFLGNFDAIRFFQKSIEYFDKGGGVNHSICPSATLPTNWDEYLSGLSSNNRQKIRRLLRKVETSEDYRITVADAATFDRDIRTLLKLWKIKWAPQKKGRDIDGMVDRNHAMLMGCAERGALFLPVFWRGDRPVAALATMVDAAKKAFLFVIAGRDESFDEMPAGYLLHAYSIRHAIDRGFVTYDFLRGNEPYKYHFASQERRLKACSVLTKTRRNLGGKLDPRGREAMFEMTLELERKGEIADAGRAYGQILEMAPDDALALYRFGRLKAKTGAYDEARQYLSRSVQIEPRGDNAWLWLARSLHALGDHAAALDAYRRVVRLQPANEEARKLILRLGPLCERANPKTGPIRAAEASPLPPPGFLRAKAAADWRLRRAPGPGLMIPGEGAGA